MCTSKFILALSLIAIAAGPALAAPLEADVSGNDQVGQLFVAPSAESGYPTLALREDVLDELLARREVSEPVLVRRMLPGALRVKGEDKFEKPTDRIVLQTDQPRANPPSQQPTKKDESGKKDGKDGKGVSDDKYGNPSTGPGAFF